MRVGHFNGQIFPDVVNTKTIEGIITLVAKDLFVFVVTNTFGQIVGVLIFIVVGKGVACRNGYGLRGLKDFLACFVIIVLADNGDGLFRQRLRSDSVGIDCRNIRIRRIIKACFHPYLAIFKG